MYFLDYIITTFDAVNISLQTGSPLIHKVLSLLNDLLKNLLSKFIKPSVLVSDSTLLAVPFHDSSNWKDDSEIMVGSQAREAVVEIICSESVFYKREKLLCESM